MIQKQHFKNRTLAAVLLLLMAMLPQLASAYDFKVNGLCYNKNSDGTSVTVTSGGNYTGAVNIPSTVTYNGNTYSVTSIGSFAFIGCSGLTSVTIPNSVTSIGEFAFMSCSGLTSITIPNSVTSIGDNPFSDCSGLTSMVVESGNTEYDSRNNCNAIIETATNTLISGCKNTIIPNSVTSIGREAFWYCTGLTSITIPNSVTSIGDGAFSCCYGLTSVIIGNSVTSIGDYAFDGCHDLISVTIPNTVTSIGGGAFMSCSGLTSITIPNSVTSIGNYAFSGCNGLTNIYCEILDPLSIEDNVFSNYNANLHVFSSSVSAYQSAYPWNKFNIVTIVQPVNSISLSQTSASIYQNETLTLSATVLPAYASNPTLSWSSSDTNVATVDQNGTVTGKRGGTATITATTTDGTNLSASCVVTVIGIYVFKVNGLCYKINSDGTSVTVTSGGDYTGDIIIPENVTYNGNTYSVTSIGDSAFYYCTGLTSVTIPNSVTSIGHLAFDSCRGLTKVNISDIAAWCNIDFMNYRSNPLTFAHNLYLNDNKVTNLVIPSVVTTIKQFAFNRCTSLTSVTIPNSVTEIGNSAFYECSGLTSVTIGNSVTSIGKSAFGDCSGLTSVTIPNSVTEIGNSAFDGCSGLTSVTIGNSVTSIGNYAFFACSGLTSVTIPNSVTLIGGCAFAHCASLTSVTIPNSVTSIGGGAFNGCSGLTKVNISDIAAWCNIDFINYSGNPLEYAHNLYLNDNKVTNLVIPSVVTTIKKFAFNNCTGLASVTIPNSVTAIGNEAFCDCSGLTNIYSRILHPENVTLGNDVFDGVDKSNCILTIPGGTLSLYQNAAQWNEFLNMVVYRLSVAPDVAHVRGAEHRVHELSIDMSNDEAISGVQFLMTLPSGVSLATDSYGYYDVWLDDARRARNHTVSVEPRSGNKYFVLISSPTNKTFSGNTGDILHMNIEVDQYHSATGDYPVTISDIIMAEADETQHNASAAQSTVRMSYLVGDANADEDVDVGDYVVTANYILGRDTGIHFFSDAANANYINNTAINVTDLVAITNIALELRDKEIKPDVSGFQRAPALTMQGTDYNLSADVIETGIYKTVIAVAVDNDEPIAAMQLDIDLPDGVTLESALVADRASGMNASCGTSPEGKARVVLSSFGTAEIAEGGGDVIMLTLRGKAQHGDLLQFSNVIMPEQSLIEHGAVGDLTLDLTDFTGVNGVTCENVNIYGSDGSVIIESPVEGMARLVRINGMSREVNVEPGRNVYPVNVSHGDIIIATFNGVTKKIQF